MSGSLSAIKAEIELALRARQPLMALVTHEEERALRGLLIPIAEQWRGGRIYAWSSTEGYRGLTPQADPDALAFAAPEPASALAVVDDAADPALFVLLDFHHYLDNAALLRKLRDLAVKLPATGKHVICLGPRFRTPEDLEKCLEVFDLPPPDARELAETLAGLTAHLGPSKVTLTALGRERLLQAMLGLTLHEADSVLARAAVRDGALSDEAVEMVLAEKRQIVRRAGLLEFYQSPDSLEDVGGLANLKQWLSQRYDAFSGEAREYGLPQPKGILCLGVQGCGKSLVARSTAREWRMPLLRMDVGRLFGRYIGESEAQIRRALRTAESVAPCILWVDEIEKGFAGAASSGVGDSGVSARVLATFLTWMQEKSAPVFVFATANQIRNLPPELLRKGRFDELFFVDIPTDGEREAIFAVHLRKRRRQPADFDLSATAAATAGFSGAEIEQVINEALHQAYADGRREPTTADLLAAAATLIPLSVTLREPIEAMRRWAKTRARPASPRLASSRPPEAGR